MIIPPNWNVPDTIRFRLGQSTYGRQRAIIEDNDLLLVLHQPPGPEDRRREGVLFWRNPAGEWHYSRGGGGSGALKSHVQTYADLEGKLTKDYEKAANVTTLFDLLEALTPLARAARNMREALQTARQGVKGELLLIEVRDLADEIERNLELLLEDVRQAIQYRNAREAELQAKLSQETLQASHRLNILAALFFPLTAMTSLFGMNLDHGLSENLPAIFWMVCAAGVGLGFIMKSWVLARPNVKLPE